MNSTNRFAVIITSIAAPNNAIKSIASKTLTDNEKKFYVIGDTKSPEDFNQEGCDFYSVERQLGSGFSLASRLPTKHYSRKNIGYLIAWREGFNCIVETDDDNIPFDNFWGSRSRELNARSVKETDWINVYRWFSKENIWPRGLPLERLTASNQFEAHTSTDRFIVPIQQGLANENPDVDAVYRMTLKLPFSFDENDSLVLKEGQWCPFNSQNTTWFKEAFPLLYLPSFCSFRMTDIWRSFIAQRVAWSCGWGVLFHSSTVYQERNEHSLLRDFEDEVPGYLLNDKIKVALQKLQLKPGVGAIYDNLLRCYEMMVENNFIMNPLELSLVQSWISDCQSLQ